MSLRSMLTQPWETIWQATLVKLPRAVPTQVLRYTSPLGPHPFILDLPLPSERNSTRTIPVYVFLPSLPELDQASRPEPSAGQDEAAKEVKLPVLLDFHGGGFYMGSPLEQAPSCAQMSRELKAVVLSVDYRMGPIDKFPAAHEDAEDVLRAVLEENSPGGIALRKAVAARVNETVTKVRRDVAATRKREAAAARRTRESSVDSKASGDSKGSVKSKTSVLSKASRESRAAPKEKAKENRRARKALGTTDRMSTDLDTSRVAIVGYSSGGNLALNMALNVPAGTPHQTTAWPCPFPATFPAQIPLLLFYPSLDMRKLPSQRHRPQGIGAGGGWFSRLNDNLALSYCPQNKGENFRISPGLASTTRDLHHKAKMFLVLSGLDTLAEQSEVWVDKIGKEGRDKDLVVERYKSMKHGWTQIPEGILDIESKQTRTEIFSKAVAFVEASWKGEDPKEALANGVEMKKITSTV